MTKSSHDMKIFWLFIVIIFFFESFVFLNNLPTTIPKKRKERTRLRLNSQYKSNANSHMPYLHLGMYVESEPGVFSSYSDIRFDML